MSENEYWKGCADKIRYNNAAKATAAMLSIRKRRNISRPDNLNPYLCKFCKGWHIGRNNSQPRKKRVVALATPKPVLTLLNNRKEQAEPHNDKLPPIIPGTFNLGELLKDLQ